MTINRWWKHPDSLPKNKIVEVITDRRASPRKAYITDVYSSLNKIELTKLIDENGNELSGNILAWRLYKEF